MTGPTRVATRKSEGLRSDPGHLQRRTRRTLDSSPNKKMFNKVTKRVRLWYVFVIFLQIRKSEHDEIGDSDI